MRKQTNQSKKDTADTIGKMQDQLNQSKEDTAAVIDKMQEQISQSETQARINDLLQLAIKKEELLFEWMLTPKIINEELLEIVVRKKIEKGQLPNSNYHFKQNGARKWVELHRHDQPDAEPKLLHWESPIKYANVILNLLGDNGKAKVKDKADDFFGLRVSLNSFGATYGHLVFLVQEMVNLGYSLDAAKVLLGASHQASEILYKLGILDKETFKRSRLISSLGGFDHRFLKVNLPNIFLKELISRNLISKEMTETKVNILDTVISKTGETIFRVSTIEQTPQTFERKNGIWSKVSENGTP